MGIVCLKEAKHVTFQQGKIKGKTCRHYAQGRIQDLVKGGPNFFGQFLQTPCSRVARMK